MRIVVVGVIRNGERSIASEIRRLHELLSPIGDLEVFVVESDSDDRTAKVLEGLQSEYPWFSFATLGRLRDEISSRTARLALCRNRYVEELQSRGLGKLDWVIVSDLDGVNTRLTTGSVATALQLDEWDAITANQLGRYYDVWALRHPLLSPNDYRRCVELYRSFGMKSVTAVGRSLYARMVAIPRDYDPIEVDSAFGGFAIYRPWVFETCRYSGLGPDGNEVSEHVPFNEAIRVAGGRVCILPGLVNAGKTEHTSIPRIALALVKRTIASRRMKARSPR